MPGPVVCDLSDQYLVVPAEPEQPVPQAACGSLWLTVTPVLTFPTAWFVKVLDCRDRGAAEVYAWLSRSIFKLWQAPDGALHRLLPEGDESTPCPCTPEGALAGSSRADEVSCLAFARTTPCPPAHIPMVGPHSDAQPAAAQAWLHCGHVEDAYTLLCAMAREQSRDRRHQQTVNIMLAKQASSLAQKLRLLVSLSPTDSTDATPALAILPGKAPQLISLMESLQPWPCRLTMLWLLCALPCQHQLQLLTHNDNSGLDCLHEWFLAADNIAGLAKREALQLALLQTLAILGQADHRLVQPWMGIAVRKLVSSSPLCSVRLAAMKFKRLTDMQATSPSGGGRSTDNERPLHKLQPEAANDFTQKDTDTVPRAPQADVVAGLHGHHALDMPETSRPVEDSSAQVTHASITAAEGRAVADKGMSAAAEGRAMAGKGTWPAAEAKARKSVHDSSHMTTSDTSPAAMEFTVIADEGISAAAEGRAVAGRGISAAGKRAVDLQDPMPTLPLRCDTSPQGEYTRGAIQRARVAIQQGGMGIQQGGSRRRLFAATDAAVMPPAKVQRLGTVTIPQVSSPYWQSVIGVRQGQLRGELQQSGVQLVQSDIAACFWQLAEAAFRPIGSGALSLGAVEYMEQVVEDGTLQACALKRLRYTTPGQRAAAHQETAALGALLGVAHIAQLVHADCYREPDTKQWSWALTMKFVPGNTMTAVYGDLWRRIRQPKGASTIRHVTHRVFTHILQAVKAMHDRHMSHTDLKPGNIIISMVGADLRGLEATVTDLGGAIFNNEWPEPNTGIHHTPYYSSPELLDKLRLKQTAINIDMCASDVWSLGCLLAEALTGTSLFGHSSDQKNPPAFQHRLDHARSSQRPWVQSFYEGCPELCIADDAAVHSIPYTNHVYKRLNHTLPDHEQRRPVFALLKSMLHPNPQLRATVDQMLASTVFHSC